MFLTNSDSDGGTVSPQQQVLVMLPLCTTTVKVDEVSQREAEKAEQAGWSGWSCAGGLVGLTLITEKLLR